MGWMLFARITTNPLHQFHPITTSTPPLPYPSTPKTPLSLLSFPEAKIASVWYASLAWPSWKAMHGHLSYRNRRVLIAHIRSTVTFSPEVYNPRTNEF